MAAPFNMLYHQMLDTAELGGGNLYALALAQWLIQNGRTTMIWCGGTGPAEAEAVRLGLRLSRCDQLRVQRGGLGAVAHLARLGWRLRRLGGLVHVHSTTLYGFFRPALRYARLRTVAHVHLEATPDEYRWAFRRPPHAIITCAGFLAKQVEAALPEATRRLTRIVPIPNAIDVERFHPGNRVEAKAAVEAPSDRPLVLMPANLAPHKGHHTAIRALKLLRERGADAELWLAGVERGGTTSYTAELQQLAAELSINDRIRFLGQRADMPELLQAADAVILPSTHEGLPLTLLEAQASGTPVLAAPTAGIPDIIRDGETGFLIAAADAEAYADRLRELFASPAVAKSIAEKALAHVRTEHNIEVMFHKITALYDSLTAE